MTYEAFLDCLESPRRTARGHLAPCPSHSDRSPSLSISEGDDGRTLVNCFSGCTAEEIVESLGLRLADLFPGKQTRESRNYYLAIKTTSKRVKEADGFRVDMFREADQFLESAKGIDIAGFSPEELGVALNLVCNAYEIQRKEEDYYEKRLA